MIGAVAAAERMALSEKEELAQQRVVFDRYRGTSSELDRAALAVALAKLHLSRQRCAMHAPLKPPRRDPAAIRSHVLRSVRTVFTQRRRHLR